MRALTVSELICESYETAVDKGWHDQPREVPEMLCLIHSEISEALEEYRNGNPSVYFGPEGKPEGLAVELADAVIRIADMCGALGLDLSYALEKKLEYNKTRPYRHGGKKA